MLPFESRVYGDPRISSAWTLTYKVFVPLLWTGAIVFLSASSPPNHRAVLLVGAVWLAGAVACLNFCVPLKRVTLDGDALLVSNYREEWRVPYALIAEVTQNRWIKLRPITIRLRRDSGHGDRIVFMPHVHLRLRFWDEDPEVDELRRLAMPHNGVVIT